MITQIQPTLEDCELASFRFTGEHRVSLRFRDGFIADLDCSSLGLEGGPLRRALADPVFFGEAFLDHGVMSWPNGYDIDPVTLRTWAEIGIAG